VRLEEARKQFFFEKKNQKTFVYKAFALPEHVGQIGKVFASRRAGAAFISKEVLSCCRWVSLKAAWYQTLGKLPHQIKG
jgi:hypothetical protein